MREDKTKLSEVIHLYLGCEVRRYHNPNHDYEVGILVGVTKSEIEQSQLIAIIDTEGEQFQEWYVEETVLECRKLSSMTEEECDKYGIAYLDGEYQKDCFEADATYGATFKVYSISSLTDRINNLRKNGFDCDGLIEKGLAIESDKNKTEV